MKAEEEHRSSVPRGRVGRVYAGFRDGKRQQEISETGGWGSAVFNYDAALDKFTADPSSADCGNTCYSAAKMKDYIFHPNGEALNSSRRFRFP